MASVLRRAPRHDDLVALARSDLVVATRAAVRLHRFVRLHVPYVDDVAGLSVGIRPVVLGHRADTVAAIDRLPLRD